MKTITQPQDRDKENHKKRQSLARNNTDLLKRSLKESKCWESKVNVTKNAVMTGCVSLDKDI